MRVLIKVQKSAPPTLENPSCWSIFFSDFLSQCLVKNPAERKTAKQILSVRFWLISPRRSPVRGSLLVMFFQHPFIANATDRHPILALLAEVNADIEEEVVIDEDRASCDESCADSEDQCKCSVCLRSDVKVDRSLFSISWSDVDKSNSGSACYQGASACGCRRIVKKESSSPSTYISWGGFLNRGSFLLRLGFLLIFARLALKKTGRSIAERVAVHLMTFSHSFSFWSLLFRYNSSAGVSDRPPPPPRKAHHVLLSCSPTVVFQGYPCLGGSAPFQPVLHSKVSDEYLNLELVC